MAECLAKFVSGVPITSEALVFLVTDENGKKTLSTEPIFTGPKEMLAEAEPTSGGARIVRCDVEGCAAEIEIIPDSHRRDERYSSINPASVAVARFICREARQNREEYIRKYKGE